MIEIASKVTLFVQNSFKIVISFIDSGFSAKTMILYALIFAARYLDLFVREQTTYLVVFKLTYIFTSVLALFAFYAYVASLCFFF